MENGFEDKMRRAEQGKEIFKRIFRTDTLNINDTYLIVLTNNKDCISYGIKYLPHFIKQHHKRNVYVLVENEEYVKAFSQAGGNVIVCDEVQELACFFNVFQNKRACETRMIILTEKDGHGIVVEDLLQRGEFTLEEYVAVSLYFLDGLPGGLQIAKN